MSLRIHRIALAAWVAALACPLARAGGTCVPLTDGMLVTTDVKICPGTYLIPDPEEDGVIRIGTSGVSIDMTGVTLIGGGKGWGIRSQVHDAVSVLGGSIQGYRAAVLFEGGQGHLVQGCDLSFNRRRAVQNGPGDFLSVWPDFAGQIAADQIGDGVVLSGVTYATVRDCRMSYQQNGIGLFQSSFCVLEGNDCSYNQGWGIHLRRSSDNQILSNRADRCFNKASSYCHTVQQDGCDSAALLLIKASDRNFVSGNALRDSGDGVFSAAQEGATFWGTSDNRYEGNDCRFAKHIGIEATFSDRNVFERNDVSGAGRYGFWLGYSRDPRVRANRIEGCKLAGISNESVQRARYESNRIAGNATGVELRQGTFDALQQDSRDHVFVDNRIVDNTGVGLRLIDTSIVRGERNVLANNVGGNLRAALALAPSVDGPLAFKGNDILLGAAPWNVSNEQATEIDLRWNWWGTTDPLAIAATIKGLEQYALIPPHRLPRLEIDFMLGSDGPWTLKRVVNERAGNAVDTADPSAVAHGNDLLDLPFGIEPSASGGPAYTTGLHFRDIWLPSDATVLGARLVLPTNAGTDALQLLIAAEAADDAEPFGDGSLPGARPTTQGHANWDVFLPWVDGGWDTSADLTQPLTEVLSRPGWKAGNSIALLVSDVLSLGKRTAWGFGREGYASLPGMPYEFRRYRKHRFMKLEAHWSAGPLAMVIERELGASADDADTCTSCNEVHFGLLGGPQTGGFRFEDVRVQPGTALGSAALVVPTDGTYTNPLQLRLWGEALATPPPYGPGSLPANRPKTNASVPWSVTSTWQFLEWHTTPDIAPILSEVLAQPGWVAGGSVAIDVADDGSAGHRRVWAFDRDPRVSPHDFPHLGATPFKPFLTAPVHP